MSDSQNKFKLLDDVISGLREYYPALYNPLFLKQIRANFSVIYSSDLEGEEAYKALRNHLELGLNNLSFDDIPVQERVRLLASIGKSDLDAATHDNKEELFDTWLAEQSQLAKLYKKPVERNGLTTAYDAFEEISKIIADTRRDQMPMLSEMLSMIGQVSLSQIEKLAEQKKANVYVRFMHFPENRETEDIGPFEFAQITYSTLRVQKPGEDDIEDDYAVFSNGYWLHDGQAYTDITIFNK